MARPKSSSTTDKVVQPIKTTSYCLPTHSAWLYHHTTPGQLLLFQTILTREILHHRCPFWMVPRHSVFLGIQQCWAIVPSRSSVLSVDFATYFSLFCQLIRWCHSIINLHSAPSTFILSLLTIACFRLLHIGPTIFRAIFPNALWFLLRFHSKWPSTEVWDIMIIAL